VRSPRNELSVKATYDVSKKRGEQKKKRTSTNSLVLQEEHNQIKIKRASQEDGPFRGKILARSYSEYPPNTSEEFLEIDPPKKRQNRMVRAISKAVLPKNSNSNNNNNNNNIFTKPRAASTSPSGENLRSNSTPVTPTKIILPEIPPKNSNSQSQKHSKSKYKPKSATPQKQERPKKVKKEKQLKQFVSSPFNVLQIVKARWDNEKGLVGLPPKYEAALGSSGLTIEEITSQPVAVASVLKFHQEEFQPKAPKN